MGSQVVVHIFGERPNRCYILNDLTDVFAITAVTSHFESVCGLIVNSIEVCPRCMALRPVTQLLIHFFRIHVKEIRKVRRVLLDSVYFITGRPSAESTNDQTKIKLEQDLAQFLHAIKDTRFALQLVFGINKIGQVNSYFCYLSM